MEGFAPKINMNSIAILVIYFEKSLSQSKTLTSLIRCNDVLASLGVSVLVWDNSISNGLTMTDLELLRTSFAKFDYIKCIENKALSYVYNWFVGEAIKKNIDYVVLLDDDSQIDESYFREIQSLLIKRYDLLLPTVVNRGIIRSPQSKGFLVYRPLKNTSGLTSQRNIMAINSGMCIAVALFRETGFRYNEKLRNYGTDNDFMIFINLLHKTLKVYLLNYSFNHDMSFFDSRNITRTSEIFREIRSAERLLCYGRFWRRVKVEIIYFLRAVKYSIKHKSLSYLR
jgi:hypothetical protein